jgi:hypothetical protein
MQTLLLNYGEPQTPRVTHVRGILIAGSRAGLQSVGFYDRYVELLPPAYKDALLYCVANSWLPLDVTFAHFDTCDRVGLTRSHFDAIGGALADRLAKTFMGAALRTVRSMGADGQLLWAVSHTDRFLRRVYAGGRCTVEQRGPKDLLLQLNGIPFAGSTYYQGVLLSHTKALLGMMCRRLFAQIVPPRPLNSESLAIALNWV